MKNRTLLFSCFILLAACQSNTTMPTTVTPSIVTSTLSNTQSMTDNDSFGFSGLPLDYDFFSAFPSVFPESAQYRVSTIEVEALDGDKGVVRAYFRYNSQGQLANKEYYDNRYRLRMWKHLFTFDQQNRLIIEESESPTSRPTDEYTPVQITYSYTGEQLTKITRKTAVAGAPLRINYIATFQYLGNKLAAVTYLNYFNTTAVANLSVPVDSVRRSYRYGINSQQITATDSVWYIACYPGMPCGNKLQGVATYQTAHNSKNDLESATLTDRANSNASLVLYPSHYQLNPVTYQNTYDGPDGLLGSITNTTQKIIYRFSYENK